MNDPIRVLLADDHAVVRAGIRQILEQPEDICIVAEAGDGEEALRLIRTYMPDVAVLDIQMPKVDGIEVTRRVRANFKNVGVLVLTAYDDDPYVAAVLRAGANGYVMKTASPAEIIQAVRDVHEGKAVLDPAIAPKLMALVAAAGSEQDFEQLTEREVEVLGQASRGYTNKAIGVQLGISDRTVQGHLARIYDKLQVRGRTEAVMRALSRSLLNGELDS